jgi:hypothetical protein
MSTSPIAENHWEVRWIAAEGTFDPGYERITAALRRWVDGMEQALIASGASYHAGLSRGLTLGQSPCRR